MATGGTVLYPGAYHGEIEKKVQARSQRAYYRYVILSDSGQQLFDGCAGDVKEASDSIKAHLRFLNAQPCNGLPA